MSRGVIYTATYKEFLGGFYEVEVPQGYNRIQFNQFTAGVPIVNKWLAPGESQNIWADTMPNRTFTVTQEKPIQYTAAEQPAGSVLMKVYCEGIDAQNNIVAAARVGDTLPLGMNGNPYKVTGRSIKIYIVNEGDLIVNNVGIVLQFTFL